MSSHSKELIRQREEKQETKKKTKEDNKDFNFTLVKLSDILVIYFAAKAGNLKYYTLRLGAPHVHTIVPFNKNRKKMNHQIK